MKNKKKLIPELRFPEFKNEEEWENPNLSNISNIIMGSSPSSISYNEDKAGLPLLQGNTDIKNRLSAPRIYTTEITKECEVGDVLLSVRAPVGTVAKSLHNACIGRGISALRAIKPNSQEYLYQWLFSYESSWDKISQGGTFNAVNSDDIRNLLIPIPKNPKEQQKIASCLSSIDEVIEAHSQKLELLKDHKKGLMQNLFPQEGEKVPKLRFKEFEKDGEWKKTILGKISSAIFDGTHQTPKYTEEGIPFFSVENIVSGKKNKFISREDYLEATSKNKPEKGDILITRIGNIGFSTVVDWDYEFSIYVTLAVIKQSDIFISHYLNGYFQSDYYQKEIRRKSLLNAAPMKINMNELQKTKVLLPPTKSEQQKIAFCLSSLDELILAQTEKIEQLKQHKKGLMQGLFPKNY